MHSSGDLVEDLTHNYFLETGARSGKLRVYEMCDHPAARALTGYLLVRGGVHQVAYARALENLTGADMSKLFPSPRIPTAKIPECQPHIEKGEHLKLYRFSPDDYREIVAVFNGTHPETGEELQVVDEAPEGFPPNDLPPQADVFAPDYAPEEIARDRPEAAQGRRPAGQGHGHRRRHNGGDAPSRRSQGQSRQAVPSLGIEAEPEAVERAQPEAAAAVVAVGRREPVARELDDRLAQRLGRERDGLGADVAQARGLGVAAVEQVERGAAAEAGGGDAEAGVAGGVGEPAADGGAEEDREARARCRSRRPSGG